MAKVELEDTKTILKSWLDAATKVFVVASSPGVTVRSVFSVVEVLDSGVLLKEIEGGTELSISLACSDTTLWYWEPREFSSDKEFEKLLASLPEADRYRSTLGVSFSGRVTARGFDDLLISLGTVALSALWD